MRRFSTILAGTALLLCVVIIVSCVATTRAPVAPTTSSTTSTMTTSTTPPSLGGDQFYVYGSSNEIIFAALKFIQVVDSALFHHMKTRHNWTIYDYGTTDNKVDGKTWIDGGWCQAHLNLPAIRQEARKLGLPFIKWLASILVHEQQHCDTMDDERPSVLAQLHFEKRWPAGFDRERAIAASQDDLTRIGPDGHWKD